MRFATKSIKSSLLLRDRVGNMRVEGVSNATGRHGGNMDRMTCGRVSQEFFEDLRRLKNGEEAGTAVVKLALEQPVQSNPHSLRRR